MSSRSRASDGALRRATQTLQMLTPGAGREGAIRADLDVMTQKLVSKQWNREHGAALRMSKCLVDAGYVTDIVHALCRHSVQAAVLMPSRGVGIGAAGKPIAEYTDATIYVLADSTAYRNDNGTGAQVTSYSYTWFGSTAQMASQSITMPTVTTAQNGPNAGMDNAIRSLGTEYDTQGNAYRFTSYSTDDGTGTPVNQVQREFNGFGQLITEYQAVNGAVNTGSTPKVQYAYSEASSGNHSRLTSMTYPNGRVLNYNYASGLDSNISRLTSLSDSSATLESLTYLGLGTVVQRLHPESGIHLTYIGTPGDAGDQYAGLDRFGRVVDQNWVDADNSNASVDRYTYGYDRNGNRLYKENELSAGDSELYAYDNLNRLTNMQRGTLAGGGLSISGSPLRSQDWTLDALGNSTKVTTDTVDEDRTHNAQNQLTGMESTTLTNDANGNQTTDETGKKLIYDAWNRLVEVQDSGSNTLILYEYDALGRRIREGTTAVYYTAGWQAIEERNGSGELTQQYVWSPVYIDALIARDRDTDADEEVDQRHYVLQDANFNVTAITNNTGTIQERFQYDAYGARSVLAANWTTSSDAYNFQHGHQGGKIDAVTGYIHFRHRELNTSQMRWMQQDPLGYVDGANRFQVANSSPLVYVDPMGLATWKSAEGTEVPGAGGTVNLPNGDKGTVRVLKDATVVTESHTRPGGIVLEFKSADPKQASCKNAHWIQFVKRYSLDKDGKEVVGDLRDSGNTYRITGEIYLDARYAKPTSVYYDTHNESSAGDNEISIWDRPGVDEDSKYSKTGAIFDAFLVVDGKVQWRVHWETEATPPAWGRKYVNISGKAATDLGEYAAESFLLGYRDLDKKDKTKPVDPIRYPNPIK